MRSTMVLHTRHSASFKQFSPFKKPEEPEEGWPEMESAVPVSFQAQRKSQQLRISSLTPTRLWGAFGCIYEEDWKKSSANNVEII